MKELMGNYFRSLETGKKKIAWCTSVGPAELLRSFGFEVYFPENHGALLGATRTAMDFIPEAIKCGYSGHVCSYTTADIGSYLKKRNASTGSLWIKWTSNTRFNSLQHQPVPRSARLVSVFC